MNLPLYQLVLVSIKSTITSSFARSSSSSPTWPLSTSLPTWRPAVRRGRNPPRWKGTWQWQNAIGEFPIETFIYKGFFYCYVWFQEGMSDKKRLTWSNVFPPRIYIWSLFDVGNSFPNWVLILFSSGCAQTKTIIPWDYVKAAVFVDVIRHFLGVHCKPGPMSSRPNGTSDGRLPRGPKVRTAISSKVSFRIKEAGRHNRIATMIDGWWFNYYSSVSVKLVDDPHDRCLFGALSKAELSMVQCWTAPHFNGPASQQETS